MFLGASESLGQDAAVALIHEKQNSSGLAASQVRQQLIDRVSLLQVSLDRHGWRTFNNSADRFTQVPTVRVMVSPTYDAVQVSVPE